jgi:two-component system sensor histidine kinase KdpD
VRRAWRSAQRLGAELDLLVVRPSGRAGELTSPQERDQLEALRRLASVLGAHLLVEEGDDVADVAIRVARARATTYLLMGTPKPRGAWRRLTQPALPYLLLRGLPGVDLRIVADRTLREQTAQQDDGP